MSVIATINVHKCDGCDAIGVNTTEADCERFAEDWFAGLEVDFCPACKDKIEHQAAIEADENSMNELQAGIREGRDLYSRLATQDSPLEVSDHA